MALETNQMQTNLQKYRDGWDYIFNISLGTPEKPIEIKDATDTTITGILERLSVISKATSFSEENKKAMMHLNNMAKVKESDNADRS